LVIDAVISASSASTASACSVRAFMDPNGSAQAGLPNARTSPSHWWSSIAEIRITPSEHG
jgi:hypothetical protein